MFMWVVALLGIEMFSRTMRDGCFPVSNEADNCAIESPLYEKSCGNCSWSYSRGFLQQGDEQWIPRFANNCQPIVCIDNGGAISLTNFNDLGHGMLFALRLVTGDAWEESLADVSEMVLV